MRTRRGTWLAISVAVLGLLGLGCFGAGDALKDKVSETVAEKVTEKAIEAAAGGGAAVDLAAGGGTVDLADLPAWLRYPGATGMARFSNPGDASSGPGEMWMLQSSDALPAVKAWYAQSLSTWKQTTVAETGDSLVLSAQSPGTDGSVTLTVTAEQGGPTSITILHARGAP